MQLKQSELKAWRIQTLAKQNGLCALCGEHLPPEKAVSDHNHKTGQLRGAIHRSCNSVLGHIERGFRYGKEFNPISFASGLLRYLCVEQPYPLHPSHGKVRTKKKKPINKVPRGRALG
jgi:hypothetical protein